MAWLKCNTYQDIKVDPVTFSYTGGMQTYTVPASGTYKLEVWGAQGGNASSMTGGKGGYASGTVTLNAGDILKIAVGGQGSAKGSANATNAGGWNGGGSGYTINWTDDRGGGGGGGATHIAKSSGTYTTLSSYGNATTANSYVYIVAGGGGGAYYHNDSYYNKNGGSGGSSASGSFGQGGSTSRVDNFGGSGGGGGWNGGAGNTSGQGGGGGSSYTSNVSNATATAGQRSGNGQAKISKV